MYSSMSGVDPGILARRGGGSVDFFSKASGLGVAFRPPVAPGQRIAGNPGPKPPEASEF